MYYGAVTSCTTDVHVTDCTFKAVPGYILLTGGNRPVLKAVLCACSTVAMAQKWDKT